MEDQNDEIVGVKSLFTYYEKMTLLMIIYEQEGSILPFVNKAASDAIFMVFQMTSIVRFQKQRKVQLNFFYLFITVLKSLPVFVLNQFCKTFSFHFHITIVGGADEVFFQELQLPMTTSRVLSLHILNKISVRCQLQHMQLIYHTFICESLKLTTMKLV